MARGTRADEIRDYLLSRIADGTWRQGQRLPPEVELAELTETSRLSVREAVKVLTADGVLTVRHGTGTFVNPVSSWRSIDAVLAVQGADDDAATELMLELLVVRGYIEVGAAEACADRVTDHEIALLERHQAALRAAHESGDVAAATRADLAFHEVVLAGAGNPFVRLVLEPVSAALATVREQTSSVARIREHAIAAHDAVLDALRERDRAAARRIMRAHMRETQQDVVRHLRTR